MTDHFFVTTPIYYVNARPHLGHAYTTLAADVLCRFYQMKDAQPFLLTGTDEHGDKVVIAAKKENLSPRNYVDQISQIYKDLWPELNIKYDYFIRTTDTNHISLVEKILLRIFELGDIYFSEYEGKYCFGCERFYTEREQVDGKCPDHKTDLEVIKESNYFFRMSKYQQWLIDYIKNTPNFIQPERYKNEVMSFLKEPLEDLCISRPKSRLKWGISLPFDNNYVTYVWFDALINYISALGYPDGELFQKYWQSSQHIVAKDILKPHAIYWPIMLKAAGIPLFSKLNVHGYWNVEQKKMSKSLGNVVEPLQLKNIYGLDSFRYFLMREMVFGLDASFSEESMVQRINSDLANDLGNLFSRVLAMAHKYFSGIIPETQEEIGQEMLLNIKSDASSAIEEFEKAMDTLSFHRALMAVWEFINQMNKYIDVTAPWEIAKKKTSKKQLEAVISNLLEGLRIVAGLIYPIMPETSMTMQKHLGLPSKIKPADQILEERPYYSLSILKRWKVFPGLIKLPKSIMLFPRVNLKKEGVNYSEEPKSVSKMPDIKPEIPLEIFSSVDLRVARVISAEIIPRAKKLLKLEVDMGEIKMIVAGIADRYSPEDLINKQIIVVANLKPAKIMGILSMGMALAASDNGALCLIVPDKEVVPGTIIR